MGRVDQVQTLLINGEGGSVVPSIDTVYPSTEVPEALRRFRAATPPGKIVISMQ